jgi:hypothetical protein
MKTQSVLLAALVLCASAQAQDWSANLDYSTDGHKYSLARTTFTPDTQVSRKLKSVYWNFGVVAGRDTTDSVSAGGGSFLVFAKGSTGFIAGVTANLLAKERQQGFTLQGSLFVGWTAKY